MPQTFFRSSEREEKEKCSHFPIWYELSKILNTLVNQHSFVIDFGCNTGGFLPTLYDTSPFKKGVGIDKAIKSIDVANDILLKDSKSRPISYVCADKIEGFSGVDIVISHEVIYLIENLMEHAENVWNCLNKNGRYIVVTGCLTDYPEWPRWKSWIDNNTSLIAQNWSSSNIVEIFHRVGFEAKFKPLGFPGFMDPQPDELFKSAIEKVEFYNTYKLVFEFIKSHR